ncbi:MAG: DUF4276 family protein [Planctomycetes bacterium]|nr:DUF4276 family protein [Planctomycetota bacterium]
MVREIRVYVEGGGDGKDTKAAIRYGFGCFLCSVRETARAKRARWSVIACGGRSATCDAFQTALRTHADAVNILLVDSEGPVLGSPGAHLRGCDGWELAGVSDEDCHLMVQLMEAWLIADPDALARFYGQGFRPNAIPASPNVEQVAKADVERSLAAATRGTTKGEYHKTRHAPALLGRVDVARVRQAAPHCERLFSRLLGSLEP